MYSEYMENVDPGAAAHAAHAHPSSPFRSPTSAAKPLGNRNRGLLPPRPPPSGNPLKRKLDVSPAAAHASPDSAGGGGAAAGGGPAPDSGVKVFVARVLFLRAVWLGRAGSGLIDWCVGLVSLQVVVRIRPPCLVEEEEAGEDASRAPDFCVRKTATNSVAIHGQDFTFDAVADAASSQEDIFKLVGLPLVENCLSGFNSSIFAYGQTGSGKTYTMWGPLSALLEDSTCSERGLTPRVFEQLFSRIKEEQGKHADKELTYHCVCSFLEIYNEQITDLLDPSPKSLQIREDVRTACVYVESLTKELVFTTKDVTQLLVKGLSNRRTGATSANADSSRSHCVFTCVIKSESKNLEDGSNCTRTSRINLVDLAGSERQKLTHAFGDRLKEAGNINRSLSQLGNLINILAEISQSGKNRHVPYRDSKLTFLLQESLGGNAKLAMICAVSPSQSCKSETLSTLRFAQRAKSIKNNAVVNEQKEEDVNMLREQIRQLKDELHRMKSGGSDGSCGGFSTGWNARRSLHLLKMSLNRPATFQTIHEDSGDVEMEIDENDVEKPYNQENMVISPPGDKEFKALQASVKINGGTSLVDAFDGENPMPTKRSCSDDRFKLNLAASIQRGLQVIENHQNNGAWRRASLGLNARTVDVQPCKVDVAIQTEPEEADARDNPLALIPSHLLETSATVSNTCRDLQLVPNNTEITCDEPKQQQILKAVEKVLAGAIRREMARDEQCAKQAAEIRQLNRLVQQYKHERECNAVIAQTREGKIARLESLMDGTLPTEEFINEEYLSLMSEHKILQQKYNNHPELLRAEIELKRLQEELEMCQNYIDEKEVLQEEIQDLKSHLHFMLSSSASICRLWPPVQLSQATGPSPITNDADGDTNVVEPCGTNIVEPPDWAEAESKWVTLTEELRVELEANKSLVGRLRSELESEKKCSEEVKEALQTAMQGHARILEQYAELEERHIGLLAMHRKIREGVEDVKVRAAKAGVKGAELRFINSLAAEIAVLREEKKGLQDQLGDTAEAVQAAGELLVRLKEAEEAEALAQRRALLAEQETEKAYQEIDNLKKNYDREIVALNQRLTESSHHEDSTLAIELHDMETTKYDTAGSPGDQQWRDEFNQQGGGSFEVSKSTDLNSWFSGYDKCNI
uniref:Kinesin motor domain-containing protein n=1 Tax=Leersia perrieri TaxID=77586 RepID=A0A0D9W3Q9_9ORYZ